MKRNDSALFGLLLLLGWGSMNFLGCGPKTAEARSEKPALAVNKLSLSAEELKQELATGAWSLHEEENVEGKEPEWLSRLIERELLVQEAQRLSLDREPDFMRTIERFWKEALIKQLLNLKGQEIGDQLQVYEPEIEAAYSKLVQESQGEPVESLSVLREDILRTIRQEKATAALEEWIAGLRGKAQITIDQEAISKLE